MNSTDITQYIDIAIRRKWSIIIPFLLVCLAGLTFFLNTPKRYKAETLILVHPQNVPEDYVRSVISTSIGDRFRTINQQLTSRTNLEKITQKYKLYPNTLLSEDKVALLRKMIAIEFYNNRAGGDESRGFTLSFQNEDPKTTMQVANALAAVFIDEDLKVRESQSIGTSSFLADELKSAENRLQKKEEALKQYRERNMGGLPEQLDTNLRISERLQSQLDQIQSNLRDADNRKILIQTQITEQRNYGATATFPSASTGQAPMDLISLRNELASLESRYTQNHPDVIRLKNSVAKLEAEPSVSSNSTEEETVLSGIDQTLKRQFQEVSFEIEAFKAEKETIQSQIKWYQEKIEGTPKKEQELLSLNRDYDNLQTLYSSLLARKLEADIAVSMEQQHKGRHIRIIDYAKIPKRPVSPNILQILLITLALGLGLGGGLAFLQETMDASYKTPEDVKDEVQLPVLISLPFRQTEKELKSIKLKNILAYTSTGLAFILSVIGIVVASKGVDNTMEFVRNLIEGT